MHDSEWLAQRFEDNRSHLRSVAYRMLGSHAEADDAVQEAWLRLARADAESVENFGGWLTTIVARVCLDMLRSRKSRREDPAGESLPHDIQDDASTLDPESEAVLADSVGLAMLIVLDTLSPAERVAFVLHDTFDVPFDAIATIVGRTTEATRQLASRARRRVRGASADRDAATQRNDELVRAFLAASRKGNFSALLALLDPKALARADAAVMAMGGAEYWQSNRLDGGIEGADAIARMFSGRANAAQAVLIDGKPGAVWLHEGQLRVAFCFSVRADRISAIDLVADPARLAAMEITFPSLET
jgi:RNA polymerase sigma factor (sigma-70 family)